MNSTTDTRPKAYSYLRFSTPEQMKGDSLRRQSALAETYALQHDLDLVNASYQDLGVSAYRGANAESGALSQFLEAVREGSISSGSYLLVESLDRLSRDKVRRAMRTLEDICDAGITVVTLADGKVYTKTILDDDPMALMYLIVVAMRANEESATKSRRLKAAWSNKRSKANEQVLTARAPTWLRLVGEGKERQFEVIEERADVVRRIFTLTLQGVGQNSIAQTLNREGVPTMDGGRVWYRSNIAKLLGSEAVIGTYTPHTIETNDKGRKQRKPVKNVPDYYPPIVDPEVFAAVKAASFDSLKPLRGRHAGGEVRNILGGLARCPECGGTMTRITKGSGPKGGKPYLVCVKAKQGGGCIYKTVKLELVEEALRNSEAVITGTVPTPERGEDLQSKLEGMWFAMRDLEDRMGQLVEAYVTSRSPAIQAELRKAESDHEEIKKAHAAMAERIAAVQGPILKKRLEALSEALATNPLDIGKANLALRTLLSQVVVNYKTGIMELEWKHGGWSYTQMFLWPDEQYLTQ